MNEGTRKFPLLLALGLAIFTCLAATRAQAERDWKYHSIWCASDSLSSTGQVVQRLLAHTQATERYCKACGGGKDQFDAILECYRDGKPESAEIRKQIETAGREKVNEFMAGKAPDCCGAE